MEVSTDENITLYTQEVAAVLETVLESLEVTAAWGMPLETPEVGISQTFKVEVGFGTGLQQQQRGRLLTIDWSMSHVLLSLCSSHLSFPICAASSAGAQESEPSVAIKPSHLRPLICCQIPFTPTHEVHEVSSWDILDASCDFCCLMSTVRGHSSCLC